MCCKDKGCKQVKGNFTYVAYATNLDGDNFSLIRNKNGLERNYQAIYISNEELDINSPSFKNYFYGRFYGINNTGGGSGGGSDLASDIKFTDTQTIFNANNVQKALEDSSDHLETLYQSKLDKVTDITSIDQVYVKKANGTQAVININEIGDKSSILIQSQKPVITNVGGSSYIINIPMSNTENGKSIWQAPNGRIFERTTNYTYNTEIDLFLKNRIDAIYVDWDGNMGHILGEEVNVGTPTPYPTNIPSNAMQYTFITFINGKSESQENITLNQVNEIVKNAKPKVQEISESRNLLITDENTIGLIKNDVILTIPRGLAGNFLSMSIYIETGSLNVGAVSGVIIHAPYTRIFYAGERVTILKRSPNSDSYLLI